MVSRLDAARDRVLSRLDQHEFARGLYVRPRGKHLILGRQQTFGLQEEPEDDDRVRLTHLGDDAFALSVKKHTGRWEKTPFAGTVDEVVDAMIGTMQHLLADWP